MNLQTSHTPEAIRGRMARLPRRGYLPDAVLGGIDGCVTISAVVAGAGGGGLSSLRGHGARHRELLVSRCEASGTSVRASGDRTYCVRYTSSVEPIVTTHTSVAVPAGCALRRMRPSVTYASSPPSND